MHPSQTPSRPGNKRLNVPKGFTNPLGSFFIDAQGSNALEVDIRPNYRIRAHGQYPRQFKRNAHFLGVNVIQNNPVPHAIPIFRSIDTML